MPSGAGTYASATLSLRDAGNEAAAFHVFGPDLAQASFDASRTLWTNLVTAAQALVLGAKASETYGNTTEFDWDQPTNGAAREIALLIQYKNATTGRRFTAKLPTLDPTLPNYVQNVNAKDVVQVDTPDEIADFITAFNAFVKDPYSGQACEVIGLKVARGGK